MKPVFNRKKAQALLELTIWGALMLIVASVMVSYILYFIYQQDLMIRNFRSAVRFAADKGRTGGFVHQIMVEHKKIPTLGASFIPGYRQIEHKISVIWSWNMFWREDESDPEASVDMVRYIINGVNVSPRLPRNTNSQSLLPAPLKGDDSFLVLSASPDETITKNKEDILNSIKKEFGEKSEMYKRVSGLFDKLEETSYKEMSDSERTNYLYELNSTITDLKSIEAVKGKQFDATKKLSDIYDYLYHERWKGDIDGIEDLLGEKTRIVDNRVETIHVGPGETRIDVSGDYTVTRPGQTAGGDFEIEWKAGEETIVDSHD